MSELDDIMAAAGIVVVDNTPSSAPGDGGDADNKNNHRVDSGRQQAIPDVVGGGLGDTSTAVLPQVAALEAMFSHRYTLDDPDFAQTVEDADHNSRPPCVTDFREKRSRDNFNRRGGGWGRGGGGGYNRHDNYNNRQSSYRDRGDGYSRNWHNDRNRDGGSYRDREDRGDGYNRNWHNDRHRDGGDGNRGYHNYQDRHRDRERDY